MYRFSTSLPYLLARLGVRMGELFGRELALDGLTLSMYRVLAVLMETGRTQRLTELSARTTTEMSTMSRLLTHMQRMGLLVRQRPENDQRSLSVGLTPKGAALAARLMPRAAYYEEVVLGELSPERAIQIKVELAQFYDRTDRLELEVAEAEAAHAANAPRVVASKSRK